VSHLGCARRRGAGIAAQGGTPEHAGPRGSTPPERAGIERRWAGAAAALATAAAAVAAVRGPAWEAILAPGRPAPQRPLAGADAAAPPGSRGPVRVVLLDGLGRADAGRLPALAALCASGDDLIVDVGFPTVSLAVQETLWTGLTPQQRGSGYRNDPHPPRPDAVPVRIPDAIAVVESHRSIAESAGFAAVEPVADGFLAAVGAAVAGPSPLVLVHVLAIDVAAHRGGRRGRDYDAALAAADRAVAAVRAAAPPGAVVIALSDHGHRARGGHGDAEDEVRRVRACVAPAVANARPGAEVHLIDVARAIADRFGVALPAQARGRPLAVAATHPDPGATLPAPAAWRWGLATGLVAALVALAVRAGGILALWPALSLALWSLVRGTPTLSTRLELDPVLAIALVPLVAAVATAATPRALFGRALTPAAAAIGAAILSGLPDTLVGGPPPRVPWFTGQLAWWTGLSLAALMAAALQASLRAVSGARTRASASRTGAPA